MRVRCLSSLKGVHRKAHDVCGGESEDFKVNKKRWAKFRAEKAKKGK